jgi:type IV pilus biogenesis protein CpaD/CtpE
VAHQNKAGAPMGARHTQGTNMNTKLLLPVLTALTLAATGTAALAAAQPADFRGSAAPAQAKADQVIVITDATRHVNVTGGSTVRFVVGERSFSWSFQNGSAHVLPFDLQLIAPQGLLNHRVTAYVSDNPLYQNN